MNQETKNKFAALLAAQNAKVNTLQAIAQKPKEQPVKAIEAIPQPVQEEKGFIDLRKNVEVSKLISFTILWHEGTGEFDDTTFATWNEANKAMLKIYNQHGDRLGYTKVKICVKWENGEEVTQRTDCSNSNGDFNKLFTIGEYLRIGLDNLKHLSFEDSAEVTAQEEETTPPEAIHTENLADYEFSDITIGDLLNEPATAQEATTAPEVVNPDLSFVDYSQKAFAIVIKNFESLTATDAKMLTTRLHNTGGKYNKYLRCGKGWIFSKKKLYTVRRSLNLI